MLSEYRDLSQLLCIKIRYHIAKAQWQEAVGGLRQGLALANHVAQGPSLVHCMVGVAIGAVTHGQIETFVQQPQAPSLHAALKAMPQPLISLEKQMQTEIDNLDKHPQVNALNKWAFKKQLKETHQRVHVLQDKFHRDITAIQVIEALRLYAGQHQGALPQQLSQIKEISVPINPMTKEPFDYKLEGSRASLTSPIPEGARDKDGMHYEITVGK
jgi:hypothetical protein